MNYIATSVVSSSLRFPRRNPPKSRIELPKISTSKLKHSPYGSNGLRKGKFYEVFTFNCYFKVNDFVYF